MVSIGDGSGEMAIDVMEFENEQILTTTVRSNGLAMRLYRTIYRICAT